MNQIACIAMILNSLFPLPVDGDSVDWLSGKELNRKTQMAVVGQWVDVPLRDLLVQLSQRYGIPIFIDRRVDPGCKVSLLADNLTWEQFLYETGFPHGYAACRIEGIYYFGPAEVAISLPEKFKKLNDWVKKNRGQAKVNWRRPVAAGWQRLSQPQKMIQSLAEEFDVQVLNADSIVFDLWPEFDAPQQPLVLQCALFAIGFERWITVSKSGKKMKIISFPVSESVSFAVHNIAEPANKISSLKTEFEDVQFVVSGKTALTLSGRPSDVVRALAPTIALQKPIKGTNGAKTFTAELKGERGSILATMAQQLSISLAFAPELRSILSEHIEFDVADATVDEIVTQTLAGTGLKYRIDTAKLSVFK